MQEHYELHRRVGGWVGVVRIQGRFRVVVITRYQKCADIYHCFHRYVEAVEDIHLEAIKVGWVW